MERQEGPSATEKISLVGSGGLSANDSLDLVIVLWHSGRPPRFITPMSNVVMQGGQKVLEPTGYSTCQHSLRDVDRASLRHTGNECPGLRDSSRSSMLSSAPSQEGLSSPKVAQQDLLPKDAQDRQSDFNGEVAPLEARLLVVGYLSEASLHKTSRAIGKTALRIKTPLNRR